MYYYHDHLKKKESETPVLKECTVSVRSLQPLKTHLVWLAHAIVYM